MKFIKYKDQSINLEYVKKINFLPLTSDGNCCIQFFINGSHSVCTEWYFGSNKEKYEKVVSDIQEQVKSKNQIIIKEYSQRFWMVAEVYKNDVLIDTINKFYEVTPEWIFIYDAEGGSGIGYSKGALLRKISISDCEFKKEIIRT